MAKVLRDDEVADYRRDGILFPLPALGPAEFQDCRRRLDGLIPAEGGKISRHTNSKPHLLLTWLAELIRRPAILDPVEDLIGPDILCWGSGFFHKPAGDPAYISWHQDST